MKKYRYQILYIILIFIISYFTYFKNYDQPRDFFWDENYHVASAQKYLDGVMFMEPHPPLGKMFVALGEFVLKPNKGINTNDFLSTDYIKNIPEEYSFKGVRFFSTLFAIFSAVIFFLVLNIISKNPHISFLFSSFYLFENALIVHNRSAMLEGSQIFFILLAILYFLRLVNKKEEINLYSFFILGLIVGLATSIKITSLILLFLFPFLFFYKNKEFGSNLNILKDFFKKGVIFILGVVIIFLGSFYVHFSLGKKVLDNDRFYNASSKYKEVIHQKQTNKLSNFWLMFKDNLVYMMDYQSGVPKYDPYKIGENGSLPIFWFSGNKSINYRWEKTDEGTKYLYLQGNPIIWVSGILGVLLAFYLITSRIFFNFGITNKKLFFTSSVFLVLYLVYMGIMWNIGGQRVMYLYHYFVPLLFSLLLLFVNLNYFFQKDIENNKKIIYISLLFFVVLVIWCYLFFSPLTYFQSLTTEEFQLRQWFDFWRLKPIL